jgi:hypothetical protein
MEPSRIDLRDGHGAERLEVLIDRIGHRQGETIRVARWRWMNRPVRRYTTAARATGQHGASSASLSDNGPLTKQPGARRRANESPRRAELASRTHDTGCHFDREPTHVQHGMENPREPVEEPPVLNQSGAGAENPWFCSSVAFFPGSRFAIKHLYRPMHNHSRRRRGACSGLER